MGQALSDDRGISIIDLLIGLVLSMAIIGMMTSALQVVSRGDIYTDEHSQALASLRLSTERLGKELRQARRVYSDSTARKVHFCFSTESVEAAECKDEERVTWELQDAPDGRARLVRYTDESDAPATWTEGLVPEGAFSYKRGGTAVAPAAATVIGITLTADITPGSRTGPRTVRTEVRIRNVAPSPSA